MAAALLRDLEMFLSLRLAVVGFGT